jgi:hypothetical protein
MYLIFDFSTPDRITFFRLLISLPLSRSGLPYGLTRVALVSLQGITYHRSYALKKGRSRSARTRRPCIEKCKRSGLTVLLSWVAPQI